MVSVPIETNTLSKLAVKLVSRSRIRNRTRLWVCSSSAQKLRATWVAQGSLGLAVTSASNPHHQAGRHPQGTAMSSI